MPQSLQMVSRTSAVSRTSEYAALQNYQYGPPTSGLGIERRVHYHRHLSHAVEACLPEQRQEKRRRRGPSKTKVSKRFRRSSGKFSSKQVRNVTSSKIFQLHLHSQKR